MMKNFVLTLNVLWITFFLASCGGGGDSDSGSNSVLAQEKTVGEIIVGDYFPLDKNSKWNYELIESDSQEGTTQSLMTASLEGEVNIKGQDVQKKRYFNSETGEVQYIEYAAKTTNAIQISYEDGTPTFDELRLPIRSGERFVQVDQSKIDIGNDYDGDGINETVSLYFESLVSGLEDVKTPSGYYAKALKLKGQGTSTYRFSYSGQTVVVKSLSESWYVDGIGLVKNVNQSIYPDKTQTSTRSLISYKSGSRTNDVSAPVITRFTPTANSTQGARPMIEVQFSEHINRDSLNHANIQLLDQDSKPVLASIEYENQKLVLALQNNLKSGTYTVRILPNTVSDLVGNLLSSPFELSFTVDGDAPSVISTLPSANAKMVPLNSEIVVEFNEEIDPALINNEPMALYLSNINGDLSGHIPTTVKVEGKKLIMTPSVPLERANYYKVFVYPTIKDKAGNVLPALYSFIFQSDIGLFGAPITIPTGSQRGEAVTIGDVNHDGLNDIVMTTGFNFDAANDYKLKLFLQQPNGIFKQETYGTLSSYNCLAGSVIIADIDGDNKSEIILGEGECGVEILARNADGVWVNKEFLSNSNGYKIQVADMDNDGKNDIVGMGWGTHTVSIWYQNINHKLNAPVTYVIAHHSWGNIKIGDINSDGFKDIVVLDQQGYASKALGYLLNVPSTKKFSEPYYVQTNNFVSGLAVGDINGDKSADIVFGEDGTLRFLMQESNGSLVNKLGGKLFNYSDALIIDDIDNNGLNDLLVFNSAGFQWSVYRQASNGLLGEEELYSSPYGIVQNSNAFAVGDINNDGFKDVVMSLNFGGLAIIYHNAIPITGVFNKSLMTMQHRKNSISYFFKPPIKRF